MVAFLNFRVSSKEVFSPLRILSYLVILVNKDIIPHMYTTLIVYSDNDSKTNAPPLKCGPVYLHHSSTKETYDIFFGRLESLLNTEIDGIEIIGQPIFGGYIIG